jgi:aromatic ring-opening dioxygenase catalytic subunit (LigB family)
MSDGAPSEPSRREALALVAIAGLAHCTRAASHPPSRPEMTPSNDARPAPSRRLPVVYLPHGGGPWPFVDLPFAARAEQDALREYLRAVPSLCRRPPSAIVAVTAHWEAPVVTVGAGARPALLFDYYGFPHAAYELTWDAPGHPAVAARVRALLDAAGIANAADAARGFDHGTFVPLKVAYPAGDVPVVQLSLERGLDPARHLAIGRALAPLRDEGVLLIGSGMSYHNMQGFFGARGAGAHSEAFDAWLGAAAESDPAERDRRLIQWASAPSARDAHPREEHLLPLMVIAGAAGTDRGQVAFRGTFGGLRISAHQFG